MRLGVLVTCYRRPCGVETACRDKTHKKRAAWLILFAAVVLAAAQSEAAEFEEVPELPWSALPGPKPGAHLLLTVPRIPLGAEDTEFSGSQWSAEPPAIGTTLWSGEVGTLSVGFAVDQEVDKGDRMWGLLRKRYTAVFAFDQPLGFSTALVVDVLSKDKRRGQKEFRILQVAISRPLAEGGSLTAGSAVVLEGFKPELNIGIRLFLPLNGP